MCEQFSLNIAVFQKNSEKSSFLPSLLEDKSLIQVNSTIPDADFIHLVLPIMEGDRLNVFQAVGFEEDSAKWRNSLSTFLQQHDFKTQPIESWLHGALYFIKEKWSESDEYILTQFEKAAVPVHIVLNLPSEESDIAYQKISQQFPSYRVTTITSDFKVESFMPLVQGLCQDFSLSLKGKVVIHIRDKILSMLDAGRQVIYRTFEKVNLIDLIRKGGEINFDDELSFLPDIDMENEVNRISDYLAAFEYHCHTPVDASIMKDLEHLGKSLAEKLDSFDIDRWFNEIEQQFKGNFGDNLLAVWKLMKFALDIQGGILEIFDRDFLNPLRQIVQTFAEQYRNDDFILRMQNQTTELAELF